VQFCFPYTVISLWIKGRIIALCDSHVQQLEIERRHDLL
jgi:hypothetical protein